MSEKDDKLIEDHEYDGIQELDNELPSWWVNLFIATVIFGVIYLGYYHMPGTDGFDQNEEFAKEMAALTQAGMGSSSGKSLYAIKCLSCHGNQAQGNPSIKAPQIAGQEDWYLKSQLNCFKNNQRGTHAEDIQGATMRTIAQTSLTSEGEIDSLVEYISSLTPQKHKPSFEGSLERGKIAFMICASCHGSKAEGMQVLSAPKLSSLNDWYMLTQLKSFKAGWRGTDPNHLPGMQMRPMAMTLVDEQAMKDVIAWIRQLEQ